MLSEVFMQRRAFITLLTGALPAGPRPSSARSSRRMRCLIRARVGGATLRADGIRCRRFDLLLFAAAFLICIAQPARPAWACAAYGDQYSENHYLYDLLMHPATTCVEYFNSAARVVAGGNTNPACGTWAVRSDAPGFQYTAGNLPCIDWLVVRIQMPDQGLWDYHYSVVVYPADDPLPQP